ncbi:MAG TPA: 2-C-methyl-D-erythritol 4-phosphate cytidylyltransferase [Anaerohalosphaeraceae bacterium]|nr:2-C-methyl-D-erythritol 4-phosphate cytidylyltransferase [Anaerohalosphaeraceae bacterium]
MAKSVSVIICAAGASARFGGDKKNPFVEMGGRAAFLRSIEAFASRDDVKQVLLCIAPDDDELVRLKWGPTMGFYGVKIVHGGKERFETVANALAKVNPDADLIAVHDSVRCCVTEEWITQVFQKAAETGAAILACPVNGTLKRVQNALIQQTVDRTNLWEAQTPQVFAADLLKKAYANLPNLDASKITDDAMLVESLGHPVSIVETDYTNLKITRKADVPIAEAILESRPKPKPQGPTGPYVEAQW